jgi:hypothetical protein
MLNQVDQCGNVAALFAAFTVVQQQAAIIVTMTVTSVKGYVV